jgi:hypothetical protein
MWPIKIYIILHLPFEGNTCHFHNNFEWDSNTEKLVTTVVNRDLWQDDILWVNVRVTEIYQSSSLVWLKSQYLHRSLSCLVLLLLLTIFLHAHLQAVYYNCVKFHLNPMSRLGGVALISPSLHTERISEYIISPSKFWTATIFLHAHMQVLYYNSVKFHKTPISRLGGVALTRYTAPLFVKV